MVLESVALTLSYAFADRFVGGGAPGLDKKLPGRSVAWATVSCAALGYFLGGWVAVCMAVTWGVYRCFPLDIPKGASATPTSPFEYAMTFIRHAVPTFLGAFATAKGFGLDMLGFCIPFAVYGIAATALAAWYGVQNAKAKREEVGIGNENVFVELTRGATYGLALAIAVFLTA